MTQVQEQEPVPVRIVPEKGTEEPSGWVLRVTPKHECNLPDIDTRTFVGSIWRCGECGQDYQVYERRGAQAGTKGLRRITRAVADERIAKRS